MLPVTYLTLLTAILFGVLLCRLECSVTFQCKVASATFTATEDQYATKRGGDIPQWKLKAYKQEVQQRPFECITNRLDAKGLPLDSVNSSKDFQAQVHECQAMQSWPKCDFSNKYRTIDGTCNNPIDPTWGSTLSGAKRVMPASYDGAEGMRKSVLGGDLPLPRKLTVKLFPDKHQPHPEINNIFSYFGQLIAHDSGDTPTANVKGRDLDCCANRKMHHQHPECAPIIIPDDDPFYSQFKQTCTNFQRSCATATCALGKRVPLNLPTAFIDCSFIYGLSDEEAKSLRMMDGSGKMIIRPNAIKGWLPPDLEKGSECGSLEKGENCFKAGDHRVNMHTPMSSFQTMFLREHNRVADELKELNPFWDEEILYQESRTIVIAEMQVIVYGEFLPLLLGPKLMDSWNLWINDNDCRTSYDPQINPSIWVAFKDAAYRLHNIISWAVTDFGADGGKRALRNFTWKNAEPIYHDEMDKMLLGMGRTPCQKFSPYVTTEMRELLFNQGGPFGVDLFAIDINRGRDAGIPPYVKVLYYLSDGAIDIQSFEQLEQVLDPAAVELLESCYDDVRDVDYYVALQFERPMSDMMIGPSAGDIIARQFNEWKYGDRFYFEHENVFSDDQLQSLKEVTLARLMCDNADHISSIPLYAMKSPSSCNPVVDCRDIPAVKLDYWKE